MPHLSRLLAAICAITVILLLVGAASSAHAEVTLFTPVAEAGSGSNLQCTAVNTGKKAVDLQVMVFTYDGTLITYAPCSSVARGSGCLAWLPGPVIATCQIIYEGNKKAMRGTLQVIDANRNSVLSLDAR